MLKKSINNWFTHFQKYFFKYKQGFYEMSYIANSPESTIESYKKMPFFKHTKKHQTFALNNFFMKVFFKYFKINEGLWLSISEISFFKNIKFNLLYDEFIEDRYYTLSINFINNNGNKISNLVNDAWPLSDLSWTLLKPRGNSNHLNLKDCDAKYVILYFSEKWLQNQLLKNGVFHNINLEKFLNSNDSYCSLLDKNQELFKWYNSLNLLFDDVIDINNKNQHQTFSTWSEFILKQFATQYQLQESTEKQLSINQKEHQKLLEIENYLMKNLTNHFIGIDELAKMFFISPTKLKVDFKNRYGSSVYQYYLSKQMILAHQLIVEKKTMIKDIAAFFGYDNVSKFTLAYKNHFGYLPSENL